MYKAARTTAVNKRGTIWQDKVVDELLAVWGEEDIQAKLDGATRNIKVFEAIAQKLHDLGFEGRMAVQCRKYMEQLDSRTQASNKASSGAAEYPTDPEDDPDKPTEEDPSR